MIVEHDFPVSTYQFEDLQEGLERSFETTITEEALDLFAEVSGDVSPLHMDSAFAQGRGFRGRVAHGAYLGALVSRLIGTMLPGRNALIHQFQLSFSQPAYAGDRIAVSGRIDRKVDAVRTIVVSVNVSRLDGERRDALAGGKVQVGITDGRSDQRK